MVDPSVTTMELTYIHSRNSNSKSLHRRLQRRLGNSSRPTRSQRVMEFNRRLQTHQPTRVAGNMVRTCSTPNNYEVKLSRYIATIQQS